MLAQKKTIKTLMFLLPAVISLLAYTAYHEMLFRKPPCLINCDQKSMFSDNQKLKKWLAFLESLRDDSTTGKKRTFPTPLDITFLQDKINLASNDNDYLSRYQKIINDLSNPNVVENAQDVGNSRTAPVSQLAYLSENNNTNNQVFTASAEESISDTPSNMAPRIGPYFAPATGNGPAFFASSGIPNNSDESTGDGGNNGGAPNNGGGSPGGQGSNGGGNPNTGTPGGGAVIGPGGNGNTRPDSGGNPISTVPAPGASYLIIATLIATGLLRLKSSNRKKLFEL